MANDGKFLTIETGRTKQELAIQTSAGAGDASKLVRTDAGGKWDLSLMPSGIGPDTKAIITSEILSAGAIVNIWDDAGTPKARNADATAVGKEADGFVLAGAGSGASATVYFEGINTQLAAMTGGTRMYLSAATPGAVTATPPSGSGNVSQYLGKALSATEVSFEPSEGVILA